MFTLTYQGAVYANFDREGLIAAGIPDSIVLEAIRSRKIAEIKEAAYRRLVTEIPEWKQRNLTARGLELTDKRIGGALTADEQAEAAAMAAAWTWIKAVRAESDRIEAAIRAAVDEAGMDAAVALAAWPVRGV